MAGQLDMFRPKMLRKTSAELDKQYSQQAHSVNAEGTVATNSGATDAQMEAPSGTVPIQTPQAQQQLQQLQGGQISKNFGVLPGSQPLQNTNAQSMVNQQQGKPLSYVDKLAEQQELQKKTYTPDPENKGRGVANWLKNAFKRPETENERRKQIQAITAVGDVFRNLANLYWTNKGATPLNIQNQTAINQQNWAQEDATKAEQQRKADELAIKQAKQRADENYKLIMAGQGQERNDIAKANLGMNMEAHGWKREDRPYELLEKAAGAQLKTNQAEKAGYDAKKAKSDADYADTLNALEVKKLRTSIAEGQARINKTNTENRKAKLEINQMMDGSGDYNLSGNRGTYSRKKAITDDEKLMIIEQLHKVKGLIKDDDYNAVMNSDGLFGNGKKKAGAIIAGVIEGAGDNEVVKQIMQRNGFTYAKPSFTYKPQK